jgi:putative peptidoglycan lipid II flippase
MKPSRSLAGIAGIVAIATLISKLFGLVRSTCIAAAFGVGAAADAYNYAYIIPGFLLVLLGGINGPLHSALVSVLAKRDKSEAAPLVETISTLVCGVLFLVAIALFIFAGFLIDLVAPGLDWPVRAIAIQQLQMMAPIAVLSGLIGIGFGTLNVAEHYWIPSISPMLSSITVIGGLGWLWVRLGNQISAPQYAYLGGLVLAGGTLVGAILQWLAQLIVQWRTGMGKLHPRFDVRSPGVKEAIAIMAPATLSSGMMHININIDFFFASYIPHAAAALSYAGLLAQTPRGILSNALLLPLLPVFSKLAAPENWSELKVRIRQGIILTALTMLPLSTLMIALAVPIVRVVYERQAFDEAASRLVASVLMAYGLGTFTSVGRDVLVRVFYALGDGKTPFRISVLNILLNIVLDYFLVKAFAAPGLVLASMGVNLTAMIMLLWCLDRQLDGLPWGEWTWAILGLTGSSAIAGLACWVTSWGCQQLWGTEGMLVLLLQLSLSGMVCLGVFALLANQLKLPEVDLLLGRLRQRFVK